MSNIHNIYTSLDTETFKALLIKLDNDNKSELKAIIIKFGATWCGPCKNIKDLCNKCYNELPKNVLYFDIDIDENAEIYMAFKAKKMIRGIPTLLGFVKRQDRNSQNWYAPDLSSIGSETRNIEHFFNCIKKY
jgi:thiol-disulfide isomerase/thioredoxin